MDIHNKKIIFLGSRINVLKVLLKCENIENITIYALEHSFLSTFLKEKSIPHKLFNTTRKKAFLEDLLTLDFDVLISNGCPIVFPVDKFKEHQILINIHPTYLPHLQGKTPMNGVFYCGYDFYGATMHYMDKGIDTGDVIYQQKENLTSDLDLGLLYHLAMKLEGQVFKSGWSLLKSAKFEYVGKKQEGEPSYFNRTEDMQKLNFLENTTSTILLRIKSFGIQSQGCLATLENNLYRIFDADEIIHNPLLDQHLEKTPGSILLTYDNKLLVKTTDGIVKITRFSLEENV